MRTTLRRAGASLLLLLLPGIAPAEPVRWTLHVPADQPIRMQRAFVERTPDASAQGPVQIHQGVNPLAQLLVYIVAQTVAGRLERSRKAEEEELVVPTDAALGAGAVALADTGAQKKYETQEGANVVIRPYVEALAGTALHDLLAGATPALAARGLQLSKAAGAAPELRLAPRFVFAADQRSLSVDAVVGEPPPASDAKASAADGAAAPRVLRVQVHSAAADAFDISDHWLRDEARVLRQTLQALLVSALEAAVPRLGRATPAAADAKPRTFRLRIGADNLYVRGVLLEAGCTQVLIDSIEGRLVVAPAAALRDQELLPADCRRG